MMATDTAGPSDRKFAAWLGSGCKRPAPPSRRADATQPEKAPKFPPGSPSSIVCLAFDDLRLGAFKLDDAEDEATWARPESAPPAPLAECAAEATCPNLGPEEFVAHFADEFVCRSSQSLSLAARERSPLSPAHEGWETLTEDSDVGFDSAAAAEFEPLPLPLAV